MTKQFKELVLEKDTVFEESVEVETSIRCKGNERYNLTVKGDISAWDINARNISAGNISAWDINARNISARNINAWDISAWDINARNISARDINARNISAWDISAGDISAWDIICESRKKKDEKSKTVARVFITGRSKLERKEW